MDIHLSIERLILNDMPVAPHQRQLLVAALEAELTQLLMAGGIAGDLVMGGTTPSLRANSIQLPGDGDPRQCGIQIARAIYSGIGQVTPETDRSRGTS